MNYQKFPRGTKGAIGKGTSALLVEETVNAGTRDEVRRTFAGNAEDPVRTLPMKRWKR